MSLKIILKSSGVKSTIFSLQYLSKSIYILTSTVSFSIFESELNNMKPLRLWLISLMNGVWIYRFAHKCDWIHFSKHMQKVYFWCDGVSTDRKERKERKEKRKKERRRVWQQWVNINTFSLLYTDFGSFAKPVQTNYHHQWQTLPPPVKHRIFYSDITPIFRVTKWQRQKLPPSLK